MSCYTEFKTKLITLRKDTPDEVIAFLNSWFNTGTPDLDPPFSHQLFKEERWTVLFNKDRYGAAAFVEVKGYWKLQLHTRINKGNEEIRQFAKWITPYVAGHKPVECIGWDRQECLSPTNVYIEREHPHRSGQNFKVMRQI